MAESSTGEFELRQISPDDNVSGLSLGHADFVPLKTYLKKFCKKHHECNVSKSYVVTEKPATKKVIAYITLVCSNIELQPPEDVGEYPYADLPAVKIGRLAVDTKYRGKKIGKTLVDWAIATTKENVMPHVGCRFLILDAKKQSIRFYERHGFRLLDTPANKAEDNPVMFLDLAKLP